MLTVRDGKSERSFALLEQFGVASLEMVAGSRLSIARRVRTPFPSFRWAIGMSQLVENSLSPPRGGLLNVVEKATPWNMNVQLPWPS